MAESNGSGNFHRAIVKYSSDFRAAFKLSERSFRNWRTAKIIPEPDGNILGRDFWLATTYERTETEILSGQHARVRRPSHLRKAALTE
jgi:hypothetical protein